MIAGPVQLRPPVDILLERSSNETDWFSVIALEFVFPLRVEELPRSIIIGLRDEDTGAASEIPFIVGQGRILPFLASDDPVLLQHHQQHLRVDHGAGVEGFHGAIMLRVARRTSPEGRSGDQARGRRTTRTKPVNPVRTRAQDPGSGTAMMLSRPALGPAVDGPLSLSQTVFHRLGLDPSMPDWLRLNPIFCRPSRR
jgi:hypothetical protein